MNYEEKYIKYKTKYLEFKNIKLNTQIGGGGNLIIHISGPQGAGKTTLLTNIGNNAIEGLPATLKTVYVQHDDRSDDFGINIVDEI
jgi:predicted AAA+ superfamily ATPase